MSAAEVQLRMVVALLVFGLGGFGCGPQGGKKQRIWFEGKDSALQQAIDADDSQGVDAALRGGADVNARGRGGVRPAMYAVAQARRAAFKELLDMRADTSLRDG